MAQQHAQVTFFLLKVNDREFALSMSIGGDGLEKTHNRSKNISCCVLSYVPVLYQISKFNGTISRITHMKQLYKVALLLTNSTRSSEFRHYLQRTSAE